MEECIGKLTRINEVVSETPSMLSELGNSSCNTNHSLKLISQTPVSADQPVSADRQDGCIMGTLGKHVSTTF